MLGDPSLDTVRVTAERVRRFATDVEGDPSHENRQLWRAALSDLRRAIRDARAQGCLTSDIQDAAGDAVAPRFARPPAESRTPEPSA